MSGEAVKIKGTREGLVIMLDPTREFEELKTSLKKKMEAAPHFFRGARFIVYGRAISPSQQLELENLCRRYGLVPAPQIPWPPERKRRPVPGEPARLVYGPLRSGQEVRHAGHVVVLGNVHPGAQVVAGGSIIIMGYGQGSLHAGYGGNEEALIAAFALSPTTLLIAGVLADPPEAPPATGGPVTALLREGRVVFLPSLPRQKP
ncbi:septum site-determining protein MinC [Desulfovirgula thermocuniculi]|uniref:septum site-determining protein MinC n=1 Tax=Desulfovirgula thermocuniculi TaxID=348842 RepID=UPI000413ABDD|nr:septum site-determining protein MinC [Desulfovirgula thermocuniculi]